MLNWAKAMAMFTNPRDPNRKKIANNTYLERRNEPAKSMPMAVAVKLHATDILTYYVNGDVMLDSGGWTTVTTKQRMNEFSDGLFSIYSIKGVWYVHIHIRDGANLADFTRSYTCWHCKPLVRWDVVVNAENLHDGASKCPNCSTPADYIRRPAHTVAFANGMVIHPDGTVDGAGEDPKAKLKLKRRIAAYAANYMRALDDGKVATPSAGDCMFCGLHEVGSGKPMGDRQIDHLQSHMDEAYYVPSLLANAIQRFPVSPAAKWYLGSFWDKTADEATRQSCRAAGKTCADQLLKALRRYLNEQFGMEGR